MCQPPPPAPPPYRTALAAALSLVDALPPERVALSDAAGRVLREPIVADRDLPPFDRAAMDGFALRHAEAHVAHAIGEPMPVVATIPAGLAWNGAVPAGACVAIATGAPVPAGLDTVVEHERSDPRAEGEPVRFRSLPALGASIHRRGRDARAGAELAPAGVRLAPQLVGLAATVGLARVAVGPRPRVALITSGDEVVGVDDVPLPHQIRNGNGPMLDAVVAAMGGATGMRAHLRDDPAEAVAALRRAAESADVVVTVGGISAGDRDPFVAALPALAADVRVRGALLQPGGPITIARLPGGGPIVVGLPGNPVSALVCAHLFLWPILDGLAGKTEPLAWREVVLAESARPNPRRAAFRPARLGGGGRAAVAPWSGSGDLASTRATDGLVELPVQETPLRAGATAPFLPWAWGFR